jgi:hypothetical protein
MVAFPAARIRRRGVVGRRRRVVGRGRCLGEFGCLTHAQRLLEDSS